MKSQKQIWDNIAPEWYDFKTKPAEHTLKFLKGKKGKILDLGSGAGRNILGSKTKATIYFVDFSEEMINLAKRRTKKEKIKAGFAVADATELPFEDDFFNYAICISLLHCIKGKEKREKAVKELYRVLKPKAQAEIGVWNINSKRFKNSAKEKYIKWRDKGARYYYLFDEKEIHKLFKKAGFKILSTHNSEMMINFVAEK